MQSISPLVISDENFDQIIGDNSLVIVDFWAEWCGPCRAMNPIIEELSLIYENKLVFAKLNVDDSPNKAQEYQVYGIPTLAFFVKGKIVDKLVGAISKSKLREKILSIS